MIRAAAGLEALGPPAWKGQRLPAVIQGHGRRAILELGGPIRTRAGGGVLQRAPAEGDSPTAEGVRRAGIEDAVVDDRAAAVGVRAVQH